MPDGITEPETAPETGPDPAPQPPTLSITAGPTPVGEGAQITVTVTAAPSVDEQLTITGLTSGNEYHFRVRAVSAAGAGPY